MGVGIISGSWCEPDISNPLAGIENLNTYYTNLKHGIASKVELIESDVASFKPFYQNPHTILLEIVDRKVHQALRSFVGSVCSALKKAQVQLQKLNQSIPNSQKKWIDSLQKLPKVAPKCPLLAYFARRRLRIEMKSARRAAQSHGRCLQVYWDTLSNKLNAILSKFKESDVYKPHLKLSNGFKNALNEFIAHYKLRQINGLDSSFMRSQIVASDQKTFMQKLGLAPTPSERPNPRLSCHRSQSWRASRAATCNSLDDPKPISALMEPASNSQSSVFTVARSSS